jgi:hypothetical protein
VNAVFEDVLEALIDVIVRDLRVKLEVSSIFIAELYPDKIFGVFREAAQDSILRFWFWTLEIYHSRCDADFIDHCQV